MAERKHLILLGILTLISLLENITFFGLVNAHSTKTNEFPLNQHPYTKAICDSSNSCQDYEIKCLDGKILSLKATRYIPQNPADWEDPRNYKTKENIC